MLHEKHVSLLTVILTLSNPPSLCTSLNNLKRFKFRYPSTGRLLIGVPVKENRKYIRTMVHFIYLFIYSFIHSFILGRPKAYRVPRPEIRSEP